MIKALLKKQLLESLGFILIDGKNGTRRSNGSLILYIGIYCILFVSLASSFLVFAELLCPALISAGMNWLYFSLCGLLAVTCGIISSVLMGYGSLYKAKDNDLLFSLPIPSGTILNTRLIVIYAFALIGELVVWIPAVAVYWMNADITVVSVIFAVLIPFIMGLFCLAVSCLLGWIIAVISAKLNNNKYVIVGFSLAFLAAYLYFYYNIYGIIGKLLVDPTRLAGAVKGIFFPFYQMGLAACGNPGSLLIFTPICAAVFAAVYMLLSKKYLDLNTVNKGTVSKKKYRYKTGKNLGADNALLIKEFRRFASSANYMLNCGMGAIFALIAAVILPIKSDAVTEFSLMISGLAGFSGDALFLAVSGAACMLLTMIDISAPSVSLEGKNLWISQVMPVSPWSVLKAKMGVHIIIASVPAAAVAISCIAVFRPGIIMVFLFPLLLASFILLSAAGGLAVNLKFPNLNWTNEIIPIKQSMSVFASMFGGWVFVIALGFGYYLTASVISPMLYMAIALCLVFGADVLILKWLRTRGTEIYFSL